MDCEHQEYSALLHSMAYEHKEQRDRLQVVIRKIYNTCIGKLTNPSVYKNAGATEKSFSENEKIQSLTSDLFDRLQSLKSKNRKRLLSEDHKHIVCSKRCKIDSEDRTSCSDMQEESTTTSQDSNIPQVMMSKYATEITQELSRDPKSIAVELFTAGIIAKSTLDETIELNNTKKDKGINLYSAINRKIQTNPCKFVELATIIKSCIPSSTQLLGIYGSRVQSCLSERPTLEKLLTLPVEDNWYAFGLWLGLHEQFLQCIADCVKSLQCSHNLVLIEDQDTTYISKHLMFGIIYYAIPVQPLCDHDPLTLHHLVQALMNTGKTDEAQKILHDKGVSFSDFTIITGNSPPRCIATYSKYLKEKYRTMSVLPDNNWPPEITIPKFINLAIIKREKYEQPDTNQSEAMAFDYAHGNIDKIVGRKDKIQLEEVFYPLIKELENNVVMNQLCILVDGAPGVGKTTLSRNISKEWANGELLREYYLVILVPLREIDKDDVQLEDLIQADDDDLKGKVVKYINQTSGKHIMFILDGFDELKGPNRKSGLIMDILHAKKLHNCSFMVCSRPYASQKLGHIHHLNRHVEIMGFTQQQISQCVKDSEILPLSEADKLIHEMEERLDVASICYIPLNCKIVIFVYEKQKFELPATLTNLYELFILHIVKHYTQKEMYPLEEDVQEAEQIDYLPEDILHQLNSLSTIAYCSLKEGTVLISGTQLFQSLPKQILHLGLLSSVNCYSASGTSTKYQFMHLTIHEFFAARHVASKEKPEAQTIFKFWLKDIQFRMCSLFLAGLTKLAFIDQDCHSEDVVIYTQDSEQGNAEINGKHTALFLAQLNYESKSACFSWIRTKLGSDCIDMSGCKLSDFDCLVLKRYLNSAPEDYSWDKIDLEACGLTSTFAERRYEFLTTIAKSKELNLYRNSISLKFITQILKEGNKCLVDLKLPTSVLYSQDASHENLHQLATTFNRCIALRSISFVTGDHISKKSLCLANLRAHRWCPKIFKELLLFVDPLLVFKIELPLALDKCLECDAKGTDTITFLTTVLSKCLKLKKLKLTRSLTTNAFESIIVSLLTGPMSNSSRSLDLDFGMIESNAEALTNLIEIMQHFAKTKLIACGMRMEFNSENGKLTVKEYYKNPERVINSQPLEYDALFQSLSVNRNKHVRELNLFRNKKLKHQSEFYYEPESEEMICLKLQLLWQSPDLARKLFKEPPHHEALVKHSVPREEIPDSEKVGQAIKKMLLNNTSLTVLNLSSCELNDIIILYLADGLKENTKLANLYVAKNVDIDKSSTVSSHAWIYFFTKISQSQSLQRLTINSNDFNSDVLVSLREFLNRKGNQLVAFKAARCNLKDEDIIALTEVLLNGVLEVLDISENSQISDAGWIQFFECASNNKTLTTLNISKNNYRKVETTSSFLKMVTENKRLLKLTVSRSLTSSEEATVTRVLTNTSSLKMLYVHGRYNPKELEERQKEECLPKGWSLKITDSSDIMYNYFDNEVHSD